MKANKKNSYEKVEASIKLHLLCIQMLFILGLVIEGQTCPDLKEFKTSIFLIITGIVVSTIIFNIVLNKWFLHYLYQQLELPAPVRNDKKNRYIVKGYLDFSFTIPFCVVASIFCYNAVLLFASHSQPNFVSPVAVSSARADTIFTLPIAAAIAVISIIFFNFI